VDRAAGNRGIRRLDEEQESALQLHKAFLRELEATQMTRSYKMIVLLAMLNEDRFPGSIGIEELVDSVRRIARRSQHIQNDFGEALRDAAALQRHLEENPIRAWKDGKGTGGHSYFHYDGAEFSFADPTSGSHRRALQDLARELCDWRLAQYLMRAERTDAPTHFLGRVREVGGRAVVELPSREEVSGIPWGEISVSIGDRRYQAHVGKRQLDRLQLPGSERNVLPEVLRGWFGPDAGRPGTRHAVFLERRDDGWEMGAETQKSARKAEIGHTYSREEIAPLFGVPYKPNVWRQGFVHQGDLFLLVTLEKKGMAAEHQYADKFLDRATFQWESQNRQARHLPSGQLLRDAGRLGKPVHLFVRATAKLGQRAAPFYYCGQLQFDSWEGDKPIRVIWKLRTPLSDHLANRMGVG
jgi:hypothetical protein